jgi:translation initiation factor 1
VETIYLWKESKGRGGRTVTLLKGFTRRSNEIEELAQGIKSAFGVGGTVKNGCIEIQGDVRKQASVMLRKLGFRVKDS